MQPRDQNNNNASTVTLTEDEEVDERQHRLRVLLIRWDGRVDVELNSERKHVITQVLADRKIG